jgi:hypothetical protein
MERWAFSWSAHGAVLGTKWTDRDKFVQQRHTGGQPEARGKRIKEGGSRVRKVAVRRALATRDQSARTKFSRLRSLLLHAAYAALARPCSRCCIRITTARAPIRTHRQITVTLLIWLSSRWPGLISQAASERKRHAAATHTDACRSKQGV